MFFNDKRRRDNSKTTGSKTDVIVRCFKQDIHVRPYQKDSSFYKKQKKQQEQQYNNIAKNKVA